MGTTNDTGMTSVDTRTVTGGIVTEEQHGSRQESTDRSAGSSTQPEWQLGTPYFRNDGPVMESQLPQSDYQIMNMNQTIQGAVSSNRYGPNVIQNQMGPVASEHYLAGQYGPMSNLGTQAGFPHPPY